MQLVEVVINGQTASKRTRNRVREAGPLFELVKSATPRALGEDGVLLRSQTTGWFGWLPVREIKLSSVQCTHTDEGRTPNDDNS